MTLQTLSVAPGNLAHLRQMVASFEDETALQKHMFDYGAYAESEWKASCERQMTTAYQIIGLLRGMGLGQ